MNKQQIGLAALAATVAVGMAPGLGWGRTAPPVSRYSGLCDASAAVFVAPSRFVVANDEDNTLRIYQTGTPEPQPGEVDLEPFLGIQGDKREADLEGATRIDGRIYWIGSHGASAKGKERPNRHRLFATDLASGPTGIELRPVGVPFRDLIPALAGVAVVGFDPVAAGREAPESPGGLNIEGLTRTPDGKLLIGLRNPIPHGMALLVPLDNPAGLVEGREPPALGPPIPLDLGGLGVRSMEYSDALGEYLIVAGTFDDSGRFALYRWSGRPSDRPVAIPEVDLQGLRPEALAVAPGENRILLLSDDGSLPVGGTPCKDLINPRDRSFRATTLDP